MGAAVSRTGTVPIYAALYGGKGSVIGTLTFRDTGTTDLDGGIHWSKPNRPATQYHRAAFETENPLLGSRYVVPQGVGKARRAFPDIGSAGATFT